jgi:hypothetical protein
MLLVSESSNRQLLDLELVPAGLFNYCIVVVPCGQTLVNMLAGETDRVRGSIAEQWAGTMAGEAKESLAGHELVLTLINVWSELPRGGIR